VRSARPLWPLLPERAQRHSKDRSTRSAPTPWASMVAIAAVTARARPCSSGLFSRGLRRVRLARGSLLTLRKSLGFWATLARVR